MAEAVGALRVELGLNSAQFQNGLKAASASMSAFSANASKIGAAIGTAMAGVAVAFGAAMKGAMNNADEMGKSAQKIGIPVEELSKLKYAASLADVDMNTLSTSMIKLSKNMADVASGGTGPAKKAFDALGISVKNADGTMKGADTVVKEISNKFAGFKDGVNKTALAVSLFGKSGAEMVPFLNEGAEAIRKAGIEAEGFGLIVTDDMSKAAQTANDNLTKLQGVASGVATAIFSHLAPQIADISEKFVDWVREADLVNKISETMKNVIHTLVDIVIVAKGEFHAWSAVISGVGAAMSSIGSGNFEGAKAALAQIAEQVKGIDEGTKAARRLHEETRNMRPLTITRGGSKGNEKPDAPFMPNTEAAKKSAEEISKAYDRINAAGTRMWEQTRTPAEKLTNELGRLQDMLSVGAITWDTHARAVDMAHAKYDKTLISMKDVGSTLENSLGGMWDDFIDGTLNAAESIKKLGQSMLKMLGNKLIGGLMDNLFGGKGTAGAGGGILGSVFKGIGIPGFAAGGDFRGGSPIIVGERGPELIMPRMAGTVIPNHELGGGGGAPAPVNVVVNNNNGSQVAVQETQGPGGSRQLEIMIEGVIGKNLAKNGGIAQQLQGIYGVKRTSGRG